MLVLQESDKSFTSSLSPKERSSAAGGTLREGFALPGVILLCGLASDASIEMVKDEIAR